LKIKKSLIYTALFLFILASIMPLCAQVSEHQGEMSKEDALKPPSEALKIIEKMQFKPIDVKVPKVGKDVERVVLKNGMILYLKEDNRFPVVNIRGLIRTGEVYESKDKYGVARLTGKVMRTGGTRKMSPETLNRELEYMAASVVSSTGTWEGDISMSVIKSQLDRGLNIFSEILRYPAFDEKELELAKSEIREELLRSQDNVGELGMRNYYKLLYPNYSMGWQYEWDVVKNIGRQDLINWHKRFYVPNNMMFAVVGDFNRKEMITKFEKLFGSWPQGKVDLTTTQKVDEAYNPGVYYIKKDVNQSYIRMGHIGVKKGNPDRYALEMMQFILGGGGFGSLLTDRVRNDEGLAYSVGSYLNLDSPVYGTFHAVSTTRNDAVIKAASLMREQIKRMQNERMSTERIEWAKNSIINSFVFEFDEPYQQTVKLMMLEYHDRPRDFYEKYTDNIRKITAEDIQKAAKKYLNPDRMIYIFVGDPEKFDKPLTTLGDPKEIILENPVKN
jgi:zinc protease